MNHTGAEFGILTSSPNPITVDVVRAADLDFVWLDAEHTTLSPDDCANLVRAAGDALDVLVRVPANDPDTLITYANTGADELILPRVRTADELIRAKRAVTYPPSGVRPRQMTSGNRFGLDWESVPRLSAIIETVDATEIIDKILQSDAVDGIWVGQRDLLDDLTEKRPDADHENVVAELLKSLRASGARWGMGGSDAAGLQRALDAGALRCVLYWEPFQVGQLQSLAATVRSRRGA